jgi:hypothetical protein
MSRTTADAVARALQGLSASIALLNPSIGHGVTEPESSSSSVRFDIESIQQKALKAVQEARILNKTSPKFLQKQQIARPEIGSGLIGKAEKTLLQPCLGVQAG